MSGDAIGVSYAENAQRVAMHPADAIRAFASLAADGHDEAAIANRYGYDPREVRKMLALASVSPKVINALAADKIDVATAQAFTLTDDHKRQERVLRRARSSHEVRSLLTESKVTTAHRLFRLVGAEAYAAAGGTVTRDLFDKEGSGYRRDRSRSHARARGHRAHGRTSRSRGIAGQPDRRRRGPRRGGRGVAADQFRRPTAPSYTN